ncbi:hypothetical protein TcBrA4_0016240 [Trypanosoma cruzi]|nr:hypothetical protein TcBrA4_0016240 [Trypanosoma cruzi]
MSSALCFVCSRCELPICSRKDLLMAPVAGGTTETAFEYFLEDVLALDISVPCYSGDEVAEVSVTVSEEILASVLPPGAQQLALEAVVASQRSEQQRQQQVEQNNVGTSLSSPRGGSSSGSSTAALPHSSSSSSSSSGDNAEVPVEIAPEEANSHNATGTSSRGALASENSSYQQAIQALARYKRVQETRVDLVCVREDVLGCGLSRCTRDRVAQSLSASSPPASVEEAQSSSSPTQWFSHPGNFIVEESFIKVRRRTKTARYPWFDAYDCRGRLECPDCHLGLGYLFVRRSNEHPGSEAVAVAAPSAGHAETGDDGTAEEAPEPQQKRERKEEGNDNEKKQKQKNDGDEDVLQYPSTFLGLELKKIRERQWGLRDFQKRYQRSKELKTFREMFPEAEELENLYSRLTALRMQSELYNNLLRKHKERNDVQSALLQSQKERIHTYEEKLRTMQQIIEAQREQLEMQGRQIKHQEELVKNHKSQVHTQQQQIHVEQLLLTEQSRTIESQREQLNLIQAHLRARLMKEKLDERCEQLTRLLYDIGGERRSQILATDTATTTLQRLSRHPLPPPHLMGVVGYDTREVRETETEERGMEYRSTDGLCQRPTIDAVAPSRDDLVISGQEGVGAAVSETRGCPSRASPAFFTPKGLDGRSAFGRSPDVSERTAAIMRRITEERARRGVGKDSLPSGDISISSAMANDGRQNSDGACALNSRNVSLLLSKKKE